ncbi:MAG TPA: hypothetical protein VHY91_27205 [Pirellulales bacterium]|nr:hypothetical protein [Pirellulales bacterium]
MPSWFACTFKEAVVLATRLTYFATCCLLLGLAAPGARADDDWLDAPPPGAQTLSAAKVPPPARNRTPRPKASTKTSPKGSTVTFQAAPGLSTIQASAQSELPEGSYAPQNSVGELTPDDLFPTNQEVIVDQPEELTGINPLSLPIKVTREAASGDSDDDQLVPTTGMTLSSGHWFNRGCWYAKEDFVYLQRSERGRHKRILATEDDPTIVLTQQSTPFPNSNGSPPSLPFSSTIETVVAAGNSFGGTGLFATSLPFGSTGNYLPINASLGFSPGARLTIGTFLGTDAMNRDSAVEFTFQGLNNWSYQNSISAYQPNQNSIFTNFVALPLGSNIPTSAPGFAFSNYQQYTYNATLNSFELNFKLSQRMSRDRSVLTREGIWARVATPQLLYSIYGGLRVIRYNETFLWRSEGTDPSMVAGNYSITTHNALFGPQFGSTITYQHENWRLTGRLAGGALGNYGDQHSIINGFDVPTGNSISRNDSNSGTTLSLLADFGLNLTYLFRPNMGIRLGYQLMGIGNLAIAEHQITFLNLNPATLNQDHGLYFQGVSGGLEFAW